jgi:hypothetical protein
VSLPPAVTARCVGEEAFVHDVHRLAEIGVVHRGELAWVELVMIATLPPLDDGYGAESA